MTDATQPTDEPNSPRVNLRYLTLFWETCQGWQWRDADGDKPRGFYRGRAGYMSLRDAIAECERITAGEAVPF